MHYYQFNIKDYLAHTTHLEPMEDLAYRRMIDYCYLNQIGLPKSLDEISRLIRLRPHKKEISTILKEFFHFENGAYLNKKVEQVIEKYLEKSIKAKASADSRWAKTKGLSDANALRTQSEGNANHKPLTTNHKPLTSSKEKDQKKRRFTPPSLNEAIEYFVNHESTTEQANTFYDHFKSNGWKVGGKAPMKDWNSAANNFIRRGKSNGQSNNTNNPRGHKLSLAERREAESREVFAKIQAAEISEFVVGQDGTTILG